MLLRFAARDGEGAFGGFLTADIGEKSMLLAARAGSMEDSSRRWGSRGSSWLRKPTSSEREPMEMTWMPGTTQRLRGRCREGGGCRRDFFPQRLSMARERAPLIGRVRPSRASSPGDEEFFVFCVLDDAVAEEDAEGDGEFEGGALPF